ncbi:MAG: helix-turn-helix domain-containing protein [Myxococcales bacterium]|nr:helix-turn-helix domain-containing protein [Myxococcales bacterium]
MTRTPHFLPKRDQLHRVQFVALEQAQALDIVGPMEAFDTANRVRIDAGKPPFYALELVARSARVKSASGLTLCATPLRRAEPADTLVIGGSLPMTDTPTPQRTLDLLTPLAQQARRTVSVCSGAFVLGELGLLRGRRCTCHWLYTDALRARFPDAEVVPDAIYTSDDTVFTSAGVTAGIDLALHLIGLDLGPRMALAVARLMVVFLHRPGGQSQFSASLRLPVAGTEERIRKLLASIVSTPGAPHAVGAMARRVGMSPRHFARVFHEQTGQTPAAFVAEVRLDAARAALEQTDETTASVAHACGFGTDESLRRAFHRALGVAPSDYRQRFRASRAHAPSRSAQPRRVT